MKKIISTIAFFALLSCNCTKNTDLTKNSMPINTIESPCPENGVCNIEIIKNKSLNVKSDEFGSTYYTLEENPSTSVIKYQYNRNVTPDLQDDNHKEEIIFEVANNETSMNLVDNDLQKSKLLFGRICFCRGQTGYYKITNGTLKLDKGKKDLYQLNLNFKVSQVPQLFTSVIATIN